MASKIDFFWELFKSVSGGTGTGITKVLDALGKSDRAKLESYFTNVIDQTSFSSDDYNRLRKFLVDLFATHRTLASQSRSTTDPHSLTNSDLDELFRSFGYPYSTQLRGFDENPLEQKIQFFLDLVNLYKVKGTPQSLVDVLQYYGVTELDIYEFLLKLDSPNNLIFDGKAVAGTSVIPNSLQIPFANLTNTDPHWLYTAQQIIQLNNTNKINLPSQTPYLGIQPSIELDGAEFSIISRNIQDQYNSWNTTGVIPPPTAEITFIGEIKSLLELYLSTVYMFNNLFEAGKDASTFMCFDGTSTSSIEIINEFNNITSPPIRRCDLNDNVPPFIDTTSGILVSSQYCADSKLVRFYDKFTRASATNFLVDKNSAGIVLNQVNPVLKAELDAAGEPLEILYSLLKDLANWVRTNIGFGFINFGFILFGINEFFKDLKNVIQFFKPYRARLLLLESLQIKNRLFNTIAIEDSLSFDTYHEVHDFLTGDSKPCCPLDTTSTDTTSLICFENGEKCQREFVGSQLPISWKGLWQENTSYSVNDLVSVGAAPGKQFVCTQLHTSSQSTKPGSGIDWSSYWSLYSQIVCSSIVESKHGYSRDTYDCGSFYDIGAVTDISKNLLVTVEELVYDHLGCPKNGFFDSTNADVVVTSGIITSEREPDHVFHVPSGASNVTIPLPINQPNLNYSIGVSLKDLSGIGPVLNYLITEKTTSGFKLDFSGIVPSDSYYVNWSIVDSTNFGLTSVPVGVDSITIPTGLPCSGSYTVSAVLRNIVDSSASIYVLTIQNQNPSNFTVKFSSLIDSSNYVLEWFVCTGVVKGIYPISPGSLQATIPFPYNLSYSNYPLLATLASTDSTSNTNSLIIINQTETDFTVKFSNAIENNNFYVSWFIIDELIPSYDNLHYYQSGGFRNFDGIPVSGFYSEGTQGRFDCTYGFDLVEITVEQEQGYLLKEDGFYLLRENGDRILL